MKYYFAQLVNPGGIPQTPADNNTLKTILTNVFILLGAICLLMVVVGGLRYILGRGNPDSVKSAKNMIVYSLAGLVLAVMAATIINLVLHWTS